MISFFSIQTELIFIPLGANGYSLSYIEAIGTLFGLICIWLASRAHIANYVFGILNVLLFAVIFYQINLYANLLLQVFFLLANFYGFYAWSRRSNTNEQESALQIHWMSFKTLSSVIVIICIAIGLLTVYIDPVFYHLSKSAVSLLNTIGFDLQYPALEPDAFPFWDSTITVLSIAAQIMMTRKLVENWILWIVIDIISVAIYAQQGVYAMSLEYIILTLICLSGAIFWIKEAKKQNALVATA